MSLLATASPWNNDLPINKKRQSTMRPPKITANDRNEGFQNVESTTFNDLEKTNTERNTRVSQLLDKITDADSAETKTNMGEFKPMEHPAINIKRDMGDNTEMSANYAQPMPSYLAAMYNMRNIKTGGLSSEYSGGNTAVYGNYNKIYDPQNTTLKPYYANMGIGSSGGGGANDSKLMEKINYMIHLLEEKHNEKTNNITEEFILYSFLGVFIIYICDSFARAGKYIR
jgi:hypothetical protein